MWKSYSKITLMLPKIHSKNDFWIDLKDFQSEKYFNLQTKKNCYKR